MLPHGADLQSCLRPATLLQAPSHRMEPPRAADPADAQLGPGCSRPPARCCAALHTPARQDTRLRSCCAASELCTSHPQGTPKPNKYTCNLRARAPAWMMHFLIRGNLTVQAGHLPPGNSENPTCRKARACRTALFLSGIFLSMTLIKMATKMHSSTSGSCGACR